MSPEAFAHDGTITSVMSIHKAILSEIRKYLTLVHRAGWDELVIDSEDDTFITSLGKFYSSVAPACAQPTAAKPIPQETRAEVLARHAAICKTAPTILAPKAPKAEAPKAPAPKAPEVPKSVTFADAVKASKKARHTLPGITRRKLVIPLGGAVITADPLELTTALTRACTSKGSTLVVESLDIRGGACILTCSQSPSPDEIQYISGAFASLGHDSFVPELPHSRSFLKIMDVPFYLAPGVLTTPSDIIRGLDSSPATKLKFSLVGGAPRIIRNSPKSDTCTVYFNIADSKSGSMARSLINKGLVILGLTVFIRGAKPQPGVPLCRCCWRWGHPSEVCRSKGIFCSLCRGPHRTEAHRDFGRCCCGDPKATPPSAPTPDRVPCPHPPHCNNCGKSHAADSRDCQFWCHRFDRSWI